jgi:hypothetical protein
MKKILFLAAVLLSITISAQPTTFQLKIDGTQTNITPNQTINVVTFPSTNSKVTFDIKNITNVAQSYRAKRYDILLHTNTIDNTAADAYFCFAGTCYGSSIFVSPTPLRLQPGKSASDTTIVNPQAAFYMLVADLDEASTVGYSIVKYTFQNVNTPSDSIQVTLKYNSASVGINKVNNTVASFEIFPNPAVESAFLNINSLKAFDGTVTVYNALGASVSEKSVNLIEGKNTVDLKVGSLVSGLYFVNIKTADVSITRRLVLK